MGTQTNQVSIATSLISAAQQTVNNYCSISCNANIGTVNITIIGGDAQINVSQTCTNIGSECTIKNLVSSEISNLIENIVEQTQSNLGILSLLGPSQSNNTAIGNSIKNQISQLINNTCNQNSSENLNALNFFSQDASVKLNYAQSGTVDHATCALDTVAKLILNNQVSNNVKQSQSSCGNVLTILIIVAIIIVAIIAFIIITRIVRGGGGGRASRTEVTIASQPRSSEPILLPPPPAPPAPIVAPPPILAPVPVTFANIPPIRPIIPQQTVNFPNRPTGPQPVGPQPVGPQPVGPQPVGPQPVGPQPTIANIPPKRVNPFDVYPM